jgi:hypothetical protein
LIRRTRRNRATGLEPRIETAPKDATPSQNDLDEKIPM